MGVGLGVGFERVMASFGIQWGVQFFFTNLN